MNTTQSTESSASTPSPEVVARLLEIAQEIDKVKETLNEAKANLEACFYAQKKIPNVSESTRIMVNKLIYHIEDKIDDICAEIRALQKIVSY